MCARLDGFSLHAARAIHDPSTSSGDRQGLEQLARYCARPALSLDRLSLTDDGRVRYRMKRMFSDGRSEVVLSPHDFLARLCALIPPPRVHLVRYFGAFAPTARGRAALTGHRRKKPAPPSAPTDDQPAPLPSPPAAVEDPTSLGAPPPDPDRPRRLDWASLLQRVYPLDVLVCSARGGRLRVVAFLTDERAIHRILDHLGIPRVAHARARPPPEPTLPFADDPGIDAPPVD